MKSKSISKVYTLREVAIILLAIYFLLAPLEDVLKTDIGTLGKYTMIPIMGILLFPSIKTGKLSFSRQIWDLSRIVLYLIILAWFSVLWAINISTAISRNSAYTTLPFVFIVLSLTEFSHKEYKLIKTAAMLGGILTVLYVLLNQSVSSLMAGRLTLPGTSNDPNNLAALLLVPVGLSFDRIINGEKSYRWVNIVLFAIFTLFMLITGSRGGLLSLVIMLVAYCISAGLVKKPKRLVLLIICFGIMAVLLVRILPENMLLRLFSKESYQSAATSAGQRGVIWRHVIFDVIPDLKPWGVGSGCAFDTLYRFYGAKTGIHNTYLCMILEYGILGITFFISLLAKLFKKLRQSNKIMELSLLLGVMCTIFFLDAYSKKFFWNVMYMAMISLRTVSEE